ncbi:hypothetical protein ASC94_13365 [Massilia sp. Root418]|jgi:hypothetical protein|uniref:hypothetical protein n=1 Tax=Massilia sp. Root418 TaxID=1736532 RepID=UPI000702267B|nr:hypothetical protein [Massilia sp. Root418]KQW93594.1 hypothetical protein ASC94_13365 [Massilia sp. Root418]
MTAHLCEVVPVRFTKAVELESFFDEHELEAIGKFLEREQPKLGEPKESCKSNLFFGFFFDGTKNNYVKANAAKNHSNVVRLYDCYVSANSSPLYR